MGNGNQERTRMLTRSKQNGARTHSRKSAALPTAKTLSPI